VRIRVIRGLIFNLILEVSDCFFQALVQRDRWFQRKFPAGEGDIRLALVGSSLGSSL